MKENKFPWIFDCSFYYFFDDEKLNKIFINAIKTIWKKLIRISNIKSYKSKFEDNIIEKNNE